jgi:hypothetical protein
MNRRTKDALFARNIGLNDIDIIVNNKYTLSSILQESEDALKKLGLSDDAITKLFKEKRPSIPEKTVYELMYESKRTCCICRESNKAIIIHHIIDWKDSHNHDKDNLVVLCLNHHDDAHSIRKNSRNLSRGEIKEAKKKWIEAVKENDIIATTSSGRKLNCLQYACWDYFNISRILDFASQENINIDNTINILNEIDGEFKSLNKCYRFDNLMVERHYLAKELELNIQEILKIRGCPDLTDEFNRKSVRILLKAGSFFTLTRTFTFKKTTSKTMGTGQNVNVYYKYKSKRLKVEFNIDLFEVLNNSSFVNLSGKYKCSCVLHVKGITLKDDITSIKCTCLAIGTSMREYESGCPQFGEGRSLDELYEEILSWEDEEISSFLNDTSNEIRAEIKKIDDNNGFLAAYFND